MERLTKKIDDSNNYCGYEVENATYKELFDLNNNEEIEFYVDCDLTLAIDKLGKIEDIEVELGCPIEVLFRALNDGIWCQDRNKLLYEPLPAFRECCIYVSDFDTYVSPSDYKKTWWLKEDKSE